MILSSLEEAISDLQKGKPIIVVDDENRENEGDIVISASKADYSVISLLVNEARGLLCVPITSEIAKKLDLPLMVKNNQEAYKTAFTVSVDASKGVTTGISVKDRLEVVRVLGDMSSSKGDLRTPGHVFPLIAKDGGVLERRGHTEASVDLMKIAGLPPVAVICEILNLDGSMARLSGTLKEFAIKHHFKIISIEQIIQYRQQKEIFIEKMSESKLPTKHGVFTIAGFKNIYTQEEVVILTKGDMKNQSSPLVRIHSQCLTGDVFHSIRCDCGDQLEFAMKKIQKEDGMIIYLFQEGRGIGILNKIKAYALQDEGLDTVDANLALNLPIDAREYSLVFGILNHYGIKKLRLLSNNPSKIEALNNFGLKVEREAVVVDKIHERENYMNTKKIKMGHLLDEN